VVALPCSGDHDYSRGLQALWPTGQTIVNVEHDMECTDELIDQLLGCPHPLCSHAYRLHPVTTGRPSHWAHRDGGTNYGEWVETGTEWCGFTGIGFCKITPAARVRPLADSHWTAVDCAVSDATEGDWHMHWPGVEHHHR
jgi:hypothetical protein